MAEQDFFEAELRTVDGKPLPAVVYDAGRVFVGEPGQEFIVAVVASIRSGATYQVSIKLDGQCPGYSKLFGNYSSHRTQQPSHDTAIWEGWLSAQSGQGPSAYRRFKFGACKPGEGAATVSNPDDLLAGRIEVNVIKVVNSGQHSTPAPAPIAALSKDAESKKLAEGKKWFLAPGLKAEAGSAVPAQVGWNTTVWQKVATLDSIHLRYDSSEALYLRKALNPRFAPHRAILRKSANPAIAKLGAEPAPPPPSPPAATTAAAAGKANGSKQKAAKGAKGNTRGAAAAAAGDAGAGSSRRQGDEARVKRETVGVKRERDGAVSDHEYVPRSATAQDRVDLTEEPVRPMTVNGRQLAPDELAVCDLCDSDDDEGAMKWQVKKMQHIKVELCKPNKLLLSEPEWDETYDLTGTRQKK